MPSRPQRDLSRGTFAAPPRQIAGTAALVVMVVVVVMVMFAPVASSMSSSR